MKAIAFFFLLIASTTAIPSPKLEDEPKVTKKLKKFPKKFYQAIHDQELIHSKQSDMVTSSYITYVPRGKSEKLDPPSATSYIHQTSSRASTAAKSGIVMDSLVAPSQDTYSSYMAGEIGFVNAASVPQNKERKPYLGYAQVQEGEGDKLRAPPLSSYAENPAVESRQVYLLPPAKQDEKERVQSSYMSYERPNKSSYIIYVRRSDGLVPIAPPS